MRAKVTAAALLLALAATACTEDEGTPDRLPGTDVATVFESGPHRAQCAPVAVTRRQSAARLTAAGVEVLASQCGIIENLMFPAVCGAGTPQIIVHEIPRGSLAAAQAAGFASTDSLTQWRLDRCPVYLHAIEVAQETTSCVESRNRVVLIQSGGNPDQRWVLLDQAGACADASYRQVLFGGQDGDEVLCSNAESIAGPQRDCAAKGHAAMFDTILANLDDEDLGLGAAYNIAQVYPAN